jgi:outer membrane protein assembly factor BamB
MHALLVPALVSLTLGQSGSWTQFRGPNGAATAVGQKSVPTEIGPDQYVLWKTPLAPGHSSPIVHGDRIFLTAVENKKLYTIGLDRDTGKIVWRTEAGYKSLEKIHAIGSHAQSTPATDGTHVVSLFGSSGLYCYDREGKEIWKKPMGPFKTEFGAASSPLIVEGRVILNQDYDSDSFLAAYDVKTGEQLWKTDRSEFPTGYASPVIWTVDGKKQIVQAGTLRVVGYDFDTGKEIWTVRGMSRICNMTPTIGPDNVLYLAGWAVGADEGERMEVPPFAEMIEKHDKNKNGSIEEDEVPKGPFKERYAQFDRNRDNTVDKKEWEGMRAIFAAATNRFVAIKPGGKGDITSTHVLWEQHKQLPYVPSPLLYQNVLFMIKNGGLLSSLDPKTGKTLKYDRIQGQGSYYASPVGGDGKVFLLNQRGDLTVVSAEPKWQVLHAARFNAEVFATPAIVDGRIYLRTAEHLYCFGGK